MERKNLNVSVIIPIYNGEKYIKKCINSVIKCPYEGYEIIAINDGSTDNTKRVLEELSKTYPQIQAVTQLNSGVSTARNNGIKRSSKDYILFLDCDDQLIDGWWDILFRKDFPKKQDITIFPFYDRNGELSSFKCLTLENNLHDKLNYIKEYVLTDNLNSSWAKLYKRDFLIKKSIQFPPNVAIGEDAIFVGEALNKCESVSYVSQPIYKYVDNENSAMHKKIRNFNDQECLFKFKENIFLKYQKELNIKYDDFLLKFLGDFLSDLRSSTVTYSGYRTICKIGQNYKFIKNLLSFNYINIPIRRRVQIYLYKIRCYFLLYIEMKIENLFLNKY